MMYIFFFKQYLYMHCSCLVLSRRVLYISLKMVKYYNIVNIFNRNRQCMRLIFKFKVNFYYLQIISETKYCVGKKII
jgi:hypothetical protein